MHGFIFVLLPYCWWTSCKLLKQELKWWKLISFFLCFSCVGAAAFPVQKKTKRAKTSNKQMERSFCFVYFHHPFFFSTTRWRWAASPNVAFFFSNYALFFSWKKKRDNKNNKCGLGSGVCFLCLITDVNVPKPVLETVGLVQVFYDKTFFFSLFLRDLRSCFENWLFKKKHCRNFYFETRVGAKEWPEKKNFFGQNTPRPKFLPP